MPWVIIIIVDVVDINILQGRFCDISNSYL